MECFQKGVFEREKCSEFQPMSLRDVIERGRFVSSILVGPCVECGSELTTDCEEDRAIDDITIGHCLECGTYWCVECGSKVEVGEPCLHWEVCNECSRKHGYLTLEEIMERICPRCEHWDNGCNLDDPSGCERTEKYAPL